MRPNRLERPIGNALLAERGRPTSLLTWSALLGGLTNYELSYEGRIVGEDVVSVEEGCVVVS